MSVDLPASVGPSRMLNPVSASLRLVSWTWISVPTRLMTFLSSRLTGSVPAYVSLSPQAGRGIRRSALPALDQLVVVDGLALGLLVVELGPRRSALAEPVGWVLWLIKPGAAATVGLGLLVGHLHARHQLIHLGGKAVHGLLRGERSRRHIADVLPEQLGELGIVGHVDPGWRPGHAIRGAVELDQAAELRGPLGEALVPDGAVADEGEADVAPLGVHRLRHHELGVEPGGLAAIHRSRLEQCPGARVLIAALRALLPIRSVRRGGHPPQHIALVVDGVVAGALGLHHL